MPQQDWFTANAPKKTPPSSGDWFAANAPKKQEPHPHARTARAVGDVLKGGWNVVKEIPAGIKQLVTDPIGSVQMMGEAQGNVGQQSKEAFDRGDYFRATVKGVEYLVPVLGPMMSAAGDKMEQGNIAEATGELATNTALTFAGMRPGAARTVTKPPRMAPPVNPKEAAAVKFAQQEGIPLDAATATGNQMLRKVQKKVESSYGGSGTADELRTAQTENLTRVGNQQLATAAPTATNPVSAGEAVRSVLKKEIETQHALANDAYTKLRKFQSDNANATPITTNTTLESPILDASGRSVRTTTSKTTNVSMAINVAETKQALTPIYDRLLRESQLAPLQGGKAKALTALDRLMRGPDIAPMADVDAALGDLKALARGAEMPELRTQGQGITALAVKKLDVQVRARAAQAGPDVLKALEDGRAATKQKYAVSEVLDMLSGEPGQVYRQLTQNKDVGLERLKAVQRLAPKEMVNVGRAFLEDMMQQATAEGGFMHADRLFANWQKLGGETKRILFPKKGQIQELDHYFLLAKRIKENPNPSGTATIPRLNVTEALAGIPAWALSKMLMTPGGVKWLTEARIVSKSPSKAARALAISNVTKAAQSAGVPLEAIPALTAEPERSTPSGIRR